MRTRIVSAALAAALAAAPAQGASPATPQEAPPAAAPPQESSPAAPPQEAPPAPPPQAGAPKDEQEPAASRSELRALAEEIRRLKLEIGLRDVEYKPFAGMGPAASKVYYAPKGLSIGGYGEVFYRNQLGKTGSDVCATSSSACDFTDILRVVVYTGYRFGEKVVFNSEVEFEHQRQVFVEFAYLDFLLSGPLKLRIGNVLVPVGITNELHEPVFFNGVERPEVERNVIPTTWNENGIGLHGELLPGLAYKVYALQGLSVAREKPSAGSWVRNLRTRGGSVGSGADQRALAETFAGVAALAYQRGPVSVGASVYRGRAGQGQQVSAADARKIEADVTMLEAHAQVATRGASLKALAVQGTMTDADLVNARWALTGRDGLGSRVRGAYAEAAFDVMSLFGNENQLVPFLRYELLKLHDQVPAGTTANPANDVDLVVAGVTYKPLPTVALKADGTWRKTGAANNAVQRAVNVGAAFVF
ncbi:MAG TPA: hypothetical protein VFL83_12120 [Anaeromyxobacter sp.]|nr:hypothetical protein [Anaeromyxobacter sp.]